MIYESLFPRQRLGVEAKAVDHTRSTAGTKLSIQSSDFCKRQFHVWTVTKDDVPKSNPEKLEVAILRVNRMLHDEAKIALYERVTFHFKLGFETFKHYQSEQREAGRDTCMCRYEPLASPFELKLMKRVRLEVCMYFNNREKHTLNSLTNILSPPDSSVCYKAMEVNFQYHCRNKQSHLSNRNHIDTLVNAFSDTPCQSLIRIHVTLADIAKLTYAGLDVYAYAHTSDKVARINRIMEAFEGE